MNLDFIFLIIISISITRIRCQVKFLNSNGFRLSWTDLGDSVRFTFVSNVLKQNNVWAGFGLSKDNSMGNDDIVICKSTDNSKEVQRHFSLGKFRPPLLDSKSPTIGLSNASIVINESKITCSFNRVKSMKSVRNHYDLSEAKYYVLFAKGLTDNSGLIQYHGVNKIRATYQTEF